MAGLSVASGAKSGSAVGLSVNSRMVAMPCWAMPRMSSKSWSSWRAVLVSMLVTDFGQTVKQLRRENQVKSVRMQRQRRKPVWFRKGRFFFSL